MKTKILPSVLAIDILNLEKIIKEIDPFVSIYHFDVMDGYFVKNLPLGLEVMKALRKLTTKKFDIHLMVERPLEIMDVIVKNTNLKPYIVSFHWEAAGVEINARKLRNYSELVFLAICPSTSFEEIELFLKEGLVDGVVVMGVNPGWSSQTFIPEVLPKIPKIKKYNLQIEVDGGIDEKIAQYLIKEGVDLLVCGAYLFKNNNPTEILRFLTTLQE